MRSGPQSLRPPRLARRKGGYPLQPVQCVKRHAVVAPCGKPSCPKNGYSVGRAAHHKIFAFGKACPKANPNSSQAVAMRPRRDPAPGSLLCDRDCSRPGRGRRGYGKSRVDFQFPLIPCFGRFYGDAMIFDMIVSTIGALMLCVAFGAIPIPISPLQVPAFNHRSATRGERQSLARGRQGQIY